MKRLSTVLFCGVAILAVTVSACNNMETRESSANTEIVSDSSDAGWQSVSEEITGEEQEDAEQEPFSPPEGIRQLAEQEGVLCSAGVRATISEIPHSENQVDEMIASYDWNGKQIRASVEMMNVLDKKQNYTLYLLQNGTPISFKIDGEETSKSYHMELEGLLKVKMDVYPEYERENSRLDFLLCCDDVNQMFVSSYTVWLEAGHEEEFVSELDGIDIRSGVSGACNGETFHAWLWNEENLPDNLDSMGTFNLKINADNPLIFEAIAGENRPYRLAFFVNGEPSEVIINGETKSTVDFEFEPNQMLQYEIQIGDMADLKEFFVLATPLGLPYISEYNIPSIKTYFKSTQN